MTGWTPCNACSFGAASRFSNDLSSCLLQLLTEHCVLACRAFYVAAFAYVYFSQWSTAICVLAAFWGATTALSRAAMGRHYVGDICAGMPLGILTVATVTQVTWFHCMLEFCIISHGG